MGPRRKQKHLRKHGWKKRSKLMKQPPKPTMEKTDETLVYFWPQTTTKEGYASMKLPDGVYIGFRSRDHDYSVKADNPSYPSKLDDDVIEMEQSPQTILKIPAGMLYEEGILSWWQRFKEQKKIFLLQNQACQVIYNAIYEGGGTAKEPLYWTPLLLEKYVRQLCRRPTNRFGKMFSLEWFYEMDNISRFLFFILAILLLFMVLLALQRIPPEDKESWTCFNDYESCKRYVKRFLKGDNSSVLGTMKDNSSLVLSIVLGFGVIIFVTHISVLDLISMVMKKNNKESESDDEDGDEDGDDDDDDDDDDDGNDGDDGDDGTYEGDGDCNDTVVIYERKSD